MEAGKRKLYATCNVCVCTCGWTDTDGVNYYYMCNERASRVVKPWSKSCYQLPRCVDTVGESAGSGRCGSSVYVYFEFHKRAGHQETPRFILRIAEKTVPDTSAYTAASRINLDGPLKIFVTSDFFFSLSFSLYIYIYIHFSK